MKIINKLIIEKKHFDILDEKIKINNLIFKDLENYNDSFILKNKDYILKNALLDYWFYLIRDFESHLTEKEKDKIFRMITANSNYSSQYASHINNRFEKGEQSISTQGKLAGYYAIYIVKKRWTELEGIDSAVAGTAEYNIAKDEDFVLTYAYNFLKNGWRDAKDVDSDTADMAERTLLKMITGPVNAISYAISIIKKRWPELERKMLTTSYDYEGFRLYVDYIKKIIGNRFNEFEKVLLKFRDIELMNYYAQKVINARWKEAEKEMLKQKKALDLILLLGDDIDYEQEGLDESYDLTILEPYIYYDMEVIEKKIQETIEDYAKKIIKGPWLEAEIE